MTREKQEPHVDRTAFSVVSLDDETTDRVYWWSLTPLQRLVALEQIRQVAYGYDPETARIEEVFEVVDLREPHNAVDRLD